MNSYYLLIYLVCALITYGIRASFVMQKEKISFSPIVKLMLAHIPSACFSALIVSMTIISPEGLNWDYYKIASIIFATICGTFIRNLMVVILSGMCCFWLLKFIIP